MFRRRTYPLKARWHGFVFLPSLRAAMPSQLQEGGHGHGHDRVYEVLAQGLDAALGSVKVCY